MIAKYEKKYFEDNEESWSFLSCLIHRKSNDYVIIDDDKLTTEIHKLADAVKSFEKETGYELSVKIW